MPAPFTLSGIDHVTLLVDGMERAVAFYTDVIGCRVKDRLPDYAMVELEAGAALVVLVDIGAEEGAWARPEVFGGRNMDHLCLALGTNDEVALRRHLKDHKVEIVEEGVHGGAGGESLSLYVRDPSGNVVELKAPPTERPSWRP